MGSSPSRLLAFLCSLALLSCAVGKQMIADSGDLSDYRAFRAAASEGTRLARAQRYLEQHPRGAWADEVRVVFDAEESAWFEAAKASRARARDYVVDLPRGPHADAALALLVMFDATSDDLDTLKLLADARRTEATLEAESRRRHRVSEVILDEMAALLDPPTWGSRIEEPPPVLARVLEGAARRTWGAGARSHRDDALFFALPAPDGAQARVAEVRLQLMLDRGRIVEGRIEGEDLFVRWAEAQLVREFDPTAERDRAAASASVLDVVAGALESRMPAARCAVPPRDAEILARECEGWSASVRMGPRQGTDDAIVLRGPRGPANLDGARKPGMR